MSQLPMSLSDRQRSRHEVERQQEAFVDKHLYDLATMYMAGEMLNNVKQFNRKVTMEARTGLNNLRSYTPVVRNALGFVRYGRDDVRLGFLISCRFFDMVSLPIGADYFVADEVVKADGNLMPQLFVDLEKLFDHRLALINGTWLAARVQKVFDDFDYLVQHTQQIILAKRRGENIEREPVYVEVRETKRAPVRRRIHKGA